MKFQHTLHTWCTPSSLSPRKGGMQWAGQGWVNCKDVCNNCAIYQINTPGTTQAYEGKGRGGCSVLRARVKNQTEARKTREGRKKGKQCNAKLKMEIKMEKFIYMRFDGNAMVGDNNNNSNNNKNNGLNQILVKSQSKAETPEEQARTQTQIQIQTLGSCNHDGDGKLNKW